MSKDLSIIVPVYNEERTILTVMKVLREKCADAEIIYVDDGSKDQSLTILHANVRPTDLVLTKPNGGKGSAVRLGLSHATGAYTVIQDADTEYDPHEIQLLLDVAKNNPGCAVFGSRFLKSNPNVYKRFLIGNKVMTWMLNILFLSTVTDSYTCYKLLPTDLFKNLGLTSHGFELEAEICAKCLKRGVKIMEVPISYKPRTIAEGKKIGWRDAWRGMLTMLAVRFSRHT